MNTAEIYLTCPRKCSDILPDEVDNWKEVAFERGDYFECFIFQKATNELTDADQQLLEWYSNIPNDWNCPKYNDGFGPVTKKSKSHD